MTIPENGSALSEMSEWIHQQKIGFEALWLRALSVWKRSTNHDVFEKGQVQQVELN